MATTQTEAQYEVKLEVFEGPLDLLLYLIRKDELDIYDIPIARITAHYLAFLQQVHRLDVEQASDFILMAATLMQIKSQMLLPREEAPPDGEAEGDPRDELVRRLLEYQQYKEVADWLSLKRTEAGAVYLRRQGPGGTNAEGGQLRPVSLFDLLQVYRHVLETVPRPLVHRIVEEGVTVEACLAHVLAELERRSRVRFMDLVEGGDRLTLIATFVALLELLKSQRIRLQQAAPFGEIWIEGRSPAPQGQAALALAVAPTAAAAEGEADA
ncbi:MAG: segregation/condensation protein A [Candidatus Latescibacterota bacterium]